MGDIEAEISVSVPEPKAGRKTFLFLRTLLPFVPSVDATITVPSGDEAVPLKVDHLELVLGKTHLHASATPHRLERILTDGRVQKVTSPEIVEMLVAAGFRVNEVLEGGENRSPLRRRRAPEKKT
jgi:hypothetical protein